jgi:hypothetical protein
MLHMNDDIPMTEYEAAFYAAFMVLVRHFPSKRALAGELRDMAGDARSQGRRNGAAVLEALAKLTVSDTRYVPSIPIMKGERTD